MAYNNKMTQLAEIYRVERMVFTPLVAKTFRGRYESCFSLTSFQLFLIFQVEEYLPLVDNFIKLWRFYEPMWWFSETLAVSRSLVWYLKPHAKHEINRF